MAACLYVVATREKKTLVEELQFGHGERGDGGRRVVRIRTGEYRRGRVNEILKTAQGVGDSAGRGYWELKMTAGEDVKEGGWRNLE